MSAPHPPLTSENGTEPAKDTKKKRGIPYADTFRVVAEEMEAEPDPIPSGPPPINDQPKNRRRTVTSQAELLAALLEREQRLSEAASNEVVFSSPLISRGEVGIIGRGTINVIQGAYGSHKSRMAELLASLLLTNDVRANDYLGFERQRLERFTVCYIDTERNLREELPFALQSIKRKAGFGLKDHPADFRFTSIKDVDRADRLRAIEAYLIEVRQQTATHLFVLLDVVTDCVSSFNDDEQAMKLFDFIGNLCDRHDATFLLVIHQNPGTEKARGHTGTEAANKASTVLQIGFEQDGQGKESELIRLRFLKLRRGKRPEPLYLQFDKASNGLILADADQIAEHVNFRKHKADVEDMADRLVSLLSEGQTPKGEVVDILMKEFSASNKTIRARLKTIMEEAPELYDEAGRAVQLQGRKEGKNEYYVLVPIVA